MTLVATEPAFAALGIDPHDEAEDSEAYAADEAPTNVETEPKTRPEKPKTKEPRAPQTHDGSKQARLIKDCTRRGDVVLDTFCGFQSIEYPEGTREYVECRARIDRQRQRVARSGP